MRARFGTVELDTATIELRSGGEVVEVEPQVFAVLTYLLDHRDRVVPKEELLDEIWGDRFVSESALTTRIKQVRRAVGDDGRTQGVIRTAHGVGYRFVAPLDEVSDGEAPTGTADSARDDGGSPSRVPVGAGGVLAPLAPLLGRDDDLRRVTGLLERHRLVTVIGPGGAGKTHLCTHLAADLSARHAGGTWLVELAVVRDPEAVPAVLLDALGVADRRGGDPVDLLARSLGDRVGLLVLDNCEHVAEVVAELATELLASCAGLRILATSRIELQGAGEVLHPLPPLDVASAAAFFAARAAAGGAQVDPHDPAVAELCRRLDGLPLAIELAAARARTLTPAELVELLADRFRLLRRDGVAVRERHRALEEVVGWSWEALSDVDRDVLGQLSTFVGPFTLEAAAAVATGADHVEAAAALDRLVAASLVVPTRGADGRSRFVLLESIREFASARLTDTEGATGRHLSYHVDLAERLGRQAVSEPDEAFAAMTSAWDNLRAAVVHAEAADDRESIRRIVVAVGLYADLALVHEVADWCARARLEEPSGDVAGRADAMAVASRLLGHQGHHERSARLAEEARALHESTDTLLGQLWCAYYTGRLDDAGHHVDELECRLGDHGGIWSAYVDVFRELIDSVLAPSGRPVVLTDTVPDQVEDGLLGTLAVLAEGMRRSAHDPTSSGPYFDAVIDVSIERDYRLPLGAAASSSTQLVVPRLAPDEGRRRVRATLERYVERQMWSLVAADIVEAARQLAGAGRVEVACRLLGAREASGYATGLSQLVYEQLRDELVRRCGDDAEAWLEQGRRLDEAAAARLAIESLADGDAAGGE